MDKISQEIKGISDSVQQVGKARDVAGRDMYKKEVHIHKGSPQKKRVPVDDNKWLHNINLKLYGWLFKKFGFLKVGLTATGTGLLSVFYLYQAFYLKWFEQTLITILFILILAYSIGYFTFFFNKECPYCHKKFSLYKLGTYKVGQTKIEGQPYDLLEIDYLCNNCKKRIIMDDKIAY